MLTSKDIIERTGISRATLNNYISCGLVPRPQVLAPGPQDGAAPRIGYFPDDTVERVETIQRLKREGWSISRIAEHFAGGGPPPAGAPAAAAPVSQHPPPVGAAMRTPVPEAAGAALRLSLAETGHPAYLVDQRFRLTWANEAARLAPVSPLAHGSGSGSGGSGSVFRHLLALDPQAGGDALVRFHLEAARARELEVGELARELSQEQAARLETIARGLGEPEAGPVAHAEFAATARVPSRSGYAVHFREGVLFAWTPGAAATPTPLPAVPARGALAAEVPAVTAMAVLFTTLQDAGGLWVRLPAREYFELANEVWAELDRIFRRHHGRPGRHPDEGLACYFLPQREGSYLWNAIAAAQQVREAMRQVSLRWQARKGWDLELCMNTGIDEGQDWMGAMGVADQSEVRVLGDAADRAEQLSRAARMGAVLVTRNLVGKLGAAERQRLAWGVPRSAGAAPESQLLFSFARLADVAAPAPVPQRLADLAVAELVDLDFNNGGRPGPASAG